MGTFIGWILIIVLSLYILFNGRDLIQKVIKIIKKKKKAQREDKPDEENKG